MALDRESVTAASRIMLPAYVVFFAWNAANYILTPRAILTDAPAIDYADQIMPMPAWGLVFAANAALMLTALIIARAWSRSAFVYALWVGIVTMGCYSLVFVAATIYGGASLGACSWPLLAATACYASQRSLLKQEV